MVSETGKEAAPRIKLGLIATLIVISTLLFITGVTIERMGGDGGETAAHQEGVETHSEQEGEEAHEHEEGTSESAESHVEAEEVHQEEEGHQETILGINIESPWVLTVIVLGWFVLVVALLRFGGWVLAVVMIAAIAATIFDIGEVLLQLNERNSGVAILAALVAVAHAATAVLAFLALRERNLSFSQRR
jgi:hypothetical protein